MSNWKFTSPKCDKRIQSILEALNGKQRTTEQLAKVVGLGFSPAAAYLRHLRESNRVHICDWDRSRSSHAAVWTAGGGEDAPKILAKRAKREHVPVEPPKRVIRSDFRRTFVPQPVERHPFDVMFFGPAYVGLSAELRGMTA